MDGAIFARAGLGHSGGLLGRLRRSRAARAQRAGDRARDARDWRAARGAYGRALAMCPDNAPIWVQYGHALKETGDPAAAEIAYRRALQLDRANADTFLQLGHALKLLERLDEAHAAYGEAVRLAPGWDEPLREQRRLLPILTRLATRAGDPDNMESLIALARRCEADGLDREASDAYAAVLRRYEGHEPAWSRYRAVQARLHAQTRAMLMSQRGEHYQHLPQNLRFVAIGTTGLCNASCIHCPTGKSSTAHVPRVPMPMPLFQKIVQEMAALHYTVETQLSLGLFGDGLVDPHVVDRVRFLREALPDARISVNTNGAAYSREKHRILAGMVSVIALHVESLEPKTYDQLMAPLRLDRVMPRIRQIMQDFPGQVHVSVPVSRLNRQELPAIHAQFMAWGAAGMGFDGLSSRCAEDQTVFRQLALDPVPIRCTSEVNRDLIVDCDGVVTICCQDFQRSEPIGNLSHEPLAEVLVNRQRRLVTEQFDAGRHTERATCSRCYGDVRLDVTQTIGAVV